MARARFKQQVPFVFLLALSAALTLWALPAPPPVLDLPKGEGRGIGGNLHPLGWSKDGKFAYLLERDPAAGESAGPWLGLRVVDLVKDEILVVKDWTEADLLGAEGGAPSFAALWAATAREVLDILAMKGLTREPAFELLGPSFAVKGKEYEVALEADLTITAKGLGSKVVAKAGGKALEGSSSFAVLGVLLSPHEPRVAIICEARDAAGLPSCVVLGAHIGAGFAKASAK